MCKFDKLLAKLHQTGRLRAGTEDCVYNGWRDALKLVRRQNVDILNTECDTNNSELDCLKCSLNDFR